MPSPSFVLGGLLALVLSAATSYWLGSQDGRKAERIYQEAEIAKAENQALKKGQAMQRAADQVAIDIAGSQAIVQEKIITKTQFITQKVPSYVSDASGCITVGLVRVLDAAALGADPAALDLAPGERNDSCSGISAAALAENVIGNYGRSKQNSAQLMDAQTYIAGIEKALGSAFLHQPP